MRFESILNCKRIRDIQILANCWSLSASAAVRLPRLIFYFLWNWTIAIVSFIAAEKTSLQIVHSWWRIARKFSKGDGNLNGFYFNSVITSIFIAFICD